MGLLVQLVYSKDTSKNSLLYPAETPFRPKSQIKLSDEVSFWFRCIPFVRGLPSQYHLYAAHVRYANSQKAVQIY